MSLEGKVKKSNVYTRTGDEGISSLYNGERRKKTDAVFMALGDTDELNAYVGIAREHSLLEENGLDEFLQEIQSRLLDIGSSIATPLHSSDATKLRQTTFPEAHTDALEAEIDRLDAALPTLKNFILPGGGMASCSLHVCRTICRRAERKACALRDEDSVEHSVCLYLNRLSDFFFVAARHSSNHINVGDTVYKNHTKITAST